MRRPVVVTVVAWLLIADAPLTVLSVLFLLRFPEVTGGKPLPMWHYSLAFMQAITFLLTGLLLLRGRDTCRLVFWVTGPVFILADAAVVGFNWVDIVRFAFYGGCALALLGSSVEQYFHTSTIET